jgi:hypothetical protein
VESEITSFPDTGRPDLRRGLGSDLLQGALSANKVASETLTNNFAAFLQQILGLLKTIPEAAEAYRIEEIELSAEISGEGKVQLIGGVTTGMKGGVTFKLKRVPDPPGPMHDFARKELPREAATLRA